MSPQTIIRNLASTLSISNYSSYIFIYLGISLIICFPIVTNIWNLLYSNGVPSGGDPADHVFFVMKILDTRNPLIGYTQFPSLDSKFIQTNALAPATYYPSFLHLVVAIFSLPLLVLGGDMFTSVLHAIQGFMFFTYLAGIVGYALLIKRIADSIISKFDIGLSNFAGHNSSTLIYYMLLVIAFSIFFYSTSPIVKTFRDGGYGEIFAMWTILPFYLLLLLKKHWILSGTLFGVIAFTHNLSFFLTSIVTVSYFIGLLIGKEYKILRQTKIYFVAALLSCLPAIVLFYFPTVSAVLNQGTGISGASSYWTRLDIADQVHVTLYFYGLCSAILLLFLNYKATAWLVGWMILYFVPFNFNLFFLERFARELSIPLGVLGGMLPMALFYAINFRNYKFKKQLDTPSLLTFAKSFGRRRAVIVLVIALIVIPVYINYFSDRFKSFGDPVVLSYYSDTLSASNKYFRDVLLSNASASNGSVVLFGVNPWLKPYLFGKISALEVETSTGEKSLSISDRNLNERLRSIIESPNSNSTISMLKQLNIKYIYLSDMIEGRWYSDPEIRLIETFPDFGANYDRKIYHLVKQLHGKGNEIVEVYAVNHDFLLHNASRE